MIQLLLKMVPVHFAYFTITKCQRHKKDMLKLIRASNQVTRYGCIHFTSVRLFNTATDMQTERFENYNQFLFIVNLVILYH